MNEYYTGIGSRNIPNTYFNLIVVIAEYMAKQGYILSKIYSYITTL